MAQLRLELGLSSVFNSRLRKYFLLLEVGNHCQLVCELTAFLTARELLSLLTTSRHFYSLLKIQAIEIRILKAKLNFYQKPRSQQSIQSLMGSLPAQVNFDFSSVKTEKLKKEHEALKNFNKNIKFMKYLKKTGIAQDREAFEKLMKVQNIKIVQSSQNEMLQNQPEKPKKIYNLSTQIPIKSTPKIPIKQPAPVKKSQPSTKKPLESTGPSINPLLQRFKEIQYRLAKEDYEKRKRQRQLQQPLMTMEELKKLAETDPCSRQIYLRVYEEQEAKYQRQNISKLKMKPLNVKTEKLQKYIVDEKVKKVVVVRESLAQKLFKNIKSIIWKETQTVSL